MSLTPEQVESIARLARLKLTDKEKEMYAGQLSAVLEYMHVLDEVDIEGVEETTQVTGLMDVVREDVAVPISDDRRAALLREFPKSDGVLLEVKAVFKEEESI